MKKVFVFIFLLFPVFSVLEAQTCDEGIIHEIDQIKQEIETMLINASTMNVALETGESLLVFYIDGQMIKISVENQDPYLSAELFFRDGFIRHIAEDVQEKKELNRNYYYFNEDRLVCYQNEKTSDYKNPDFYAAAEKKWLINIERYLLAIQ